MRGSCESGLTNKIRVIQYTIFLLTNHGQTRKMHETNLVNFTQTISRVSVFTRSICQRPSFCFWIIKIELFIFNLISELCSQLEGTRSNCNLFQWPLYCRCTGNSAGQPQKCWVEQVGQQLPFPIIYSLLEFILTVQAENGAEHLSHLKKNGPVVYLA